MKSIFEGKKVSINSTLKNNSLIPSFFRNLPFDKIKNDILGYDYELSIVLIGTCKSEALNSKFRNKNYPTDVLSFKLGDNAGELFICPKIAKSKCKEFNMDLPNYLLFIVIHGSLHLKGLNHGAKMEDNELTYHNRYRRRHL